MRISLTHRPPFLDKALLLVSQLAVRNSVKNGWLNKGTWQNGYVAHSLQLIHTSVHLQGGLQNKTKLLTPLKRLATRNVRRKKIGDA